MPWCSVQRMNPNRGDLQCYVATDQVLFPTEQYYIPIPYPVYGDRDVQPSLKTRARVYSFTAHRELSKQQKAPITNPLSSIHATQLRYGARAHQFGLSRVGELVPTPGPSGRDRLMFVLSCPALLTNRCGGLIVSETRSGDRRAQFRYLVLRGSSLVTVDILLHLRAPLQSHIC